MRGGFLTQEQVQSFFDNGGVVKRRKDIGLIRSDVRDLYTATWEPLSRKFTFDFSPLKQIEEAKRIVVVGVLKSIMRGYMDAVFGKGKITGLLNGTVSDTKIELTVTDDKITSVKEIIGTSDAVEKTTGNSGVFETFKAKFKEVNKDDPKDTLELV
jgi:hypothetical protein